VTQGLTDAASRFNQWQHAFAVIAKNNTLFTAQRIRLRESFNFETVETKGYQAAND